MLRITELVDAAPNGRGARILKVEGALRGEMIAELRRVWERVREAVTGAHIRVDLADVGCVDTAGKALLAEMYRDGVEIVARGVLARGIVDEIVGAGPSNR